MMHEHVNMSNCQILIFVLDKTEFLQVKNLQMFCFF